MERYAHAQLFATLTKKPQMEFATLTPTYYYTKQFALASLVRFPLPTCRMFIFFVFWFLGLC